MPEIRKNDLVSLADGSPARVEEVINVNGSNVYRIQKMIDKEIIYVEASLLQLKKQCNFNFLITTLKEIGTFFLHLITPVGFGCKQLRQKG